MILTGYGIAVLLQEASLVFSGYYFIGGIFCALFQVWSQKSSTPWLADFMYLMVGVPIFSLVGAYTVWA